QQRLAFAHAMLALLPPDRQPRFAIHPMQPLVVHLFSASPQQHLQPPIPKARLLSRQLYQPRPQRFIASFRSIAMTRHRYPHQPAPPALTGCVLSPQPDHARPLVYELHPFFAIPAFSISLSRLRSTTSFFSFVFSSRNCLASCASLTSIPPYFAFQA